MEGDRAYTKQDMLIIIGDANAKVGSNNIGHRRVMGKEGLGTINENCESLVELCEEYNV